MLDDLHFGQGSVFFLIQWLDADTSVNDCCELLNQNLGDELEYYRVGRDVNSSKSDQASYVEPFTE